MSLTSTLASVKARLSPFVADLAIGLSRIGFAALAWAITVVIGATLVAVTGKIIVTIWRHIV